MIQICLLTFFWDKAKNVWFCLFSLLFFKKWLKLQYDIQIGGAANFGFISITYHQYIFGLYKYILRLELSIFDRENAKNRPEFRMIMCFWDIQSGRGISTNVGYQEIFSFSNILISPIDILIVSYDVKTCWWKVHIFP